MLDKFFDSMREKHITRLLGEQPTKEEPKPIHQQIIDAVGGEDRFREIANLEPKQRQADRTYSEEDLGKAVTMARTFCKTRDGEGYDEYQYTPAEIIQSIKQQ